MQQPRPQPPHPQGQRLTPPDRTPPQQGPLPDSIFPPATSSTHNFDETKLPSCVKSNITPEDERIKRVRTCRFIEEVCRILQLPRVGISTAMVFFHRFYAAHSFADHDRFEVAVACILIAAKTEESPRKLTHVIQESWRLKNSAQKSSADGNSAVNETEVTADGKSPSRLDNSSPRTATSSSVDKNGYLDTKSEEFVKLKERILLLERIVLHTIGFELSVDHPYKFLVEQVKKMVPSRQVEYIEPVVPAPPPTKIMNDLVQSAMNFANDSMYTSLCLQYPPKSIGLTCVYMGCRVCKIKPVEGKIWSDVLDIDVETLASIAVQILELIAFKKSTDSKLFDAIRVDIDELRKVQRGGGLASKIDSTAGESNPKRQRL